MYLASSVYAAFALCLISMVGWASWPNMMYFCRDRIPFGGFYCDFVLGLMFIATLAGFLLGTVQEEGPLGSDRSFIDDFQVSVDRGLLAIAAGFLWGVANLLLMHGIRMCGMAIAFPLINGTALVLGTLLTYMVDSSGIDEMFLLTGVLIALAAVCLISIVHRLKEMNEAQETVQRGLICQGPSTFRKLLVCAVSGLFLSCWSPFATAAQHNFGKAVRDPGLSPYGEFFFFCVGGVLATVVVLPVSLRHPFDGSKGVRLKHVLREYRQAPLICHIYGVLAGFIWAAGTLANALAGTNLKFAVSYAIGMAAPMISIFWGVCYFHEFARCTATVKSLLVVACLLYSASVGCVALAHT